jgi:hypothetical protein
MYAIKFSRITLRYCDANIMQNVMDILVQYIRVTQFYYPIERYWPSL